METERKLRELLSLCEYYKVREQVKADLLRNLAGKEIGKGLYCSALRLYIEAGDLIRSRIASTMLVVCT